VFLQSTKFSKLLTTQLVFTVVEVELLVMFSKLVGFRVGERNSNPNTIFLGLNSMLQTNKKKKILILNQKLYILFILT